MAQQRKRTAGDDLRDFKAGKISGNFYHNGIDRSDNYIQHTSAPRYITDENGKTQVASYNEWIQQEVFQHQHELPNGTSSTAVKTGNKNSSKNSEPFLGLPKTNIDTIKDSGIKNKNGQNNSFDFQKAQSDFEATIKNPNKPLEDKVKALSDDYNTAIKNNDIKTAKAIEKEYNAIAEKVNNQAKINQQNAETAEAENAKLAEQAEKEQKFSDKYKNSTLEQRKNARIHATTEELDWLNKHMYDNSSSKELEDYNNQLNKEANSLWNQRDEEQVYNRLKAIEDEQGKLKTAIGNAKLSEQKKKEYDDIVNNDITVKTVLQKYYALQEYSSNQSLVRSAENTDGAKNQVILDDYNYINKLSGKERNQIVKDFNNLKKEGYDTESLYKWYKRERDAESAAETTRVYTDYADKHPVLGSLQSVGVRLMGAVPDAVKYVSAKADKTYGGDGYINPEETGTAISDAMRAKVSEKIDNDFGLFLYNTGMSMADFASLLPLNAVPGGQALSLGIMGTSAGVGAANEVINNGGTIDNAVKTGIAAGIAETLFEKVSLEQLSVFKASGKSTFRAAVGNVLKGAFTEGSEEAFTDLANRLTDDAINKDLSSYNLSKKNYMEQGMSEADAENAASWNFWKEVGLDFAGGAISGGVLNLATAGVNLGGVQMELAQNKESNIADGKKALADENFDLDLLIRQGLVADKGDKAYNLAKRMQKSIDKKGRESIEAADVGNLRYLIGREISRNPDLINKIAQVEKQNTQEQGNKTVNLQSEQNPTQQNTVQNMQNTAQNGQQNAEQTQASTVINATKKADTEDIGKMYGVYAFGKKHPNGIIATDTSTGKVVKVALKSLESSAKINRSDEENTLVFNTNDGKQVNADSITFSDGQLDTIVHSANEFDTYGARNYISNFEEWRESPQAQKMSDEEMLYKYNRAYSAAYSFGREGVKLDSLKETSEYKILKNILGENIVSQALSTGRRDVDINTQHHANRLTELINRNGRADTSGVSVYADSGTDVSHIPQELISALGNLAHKTGRNIIISDRLADGVNGVARDGNIILSSEISSQKILATALHEAGHMIKKTNPTEWRTLSDFVSDYLVRKGVDLNKMIDRTIERYGNRLQADENENTRDAALEEIVCDTLMSIASDEKALNIALGTKQNKAKIAAAIKSLIAKIKDWLIGQSTNYGAKAFTKDIEALETLAERFSEAADTARKNITEQSEVQNGEKIKYSFAGEHAKNANLSLLDRAKLMDKNGDSSEDIRKTTGWFKGYDGKWRFEIDDSMIVIDTSGRLSKNPDIRRFYELMDKVHIDGNATDSEIAELSKLDKKLEGVSLRPKTLGELLVHTKLFDAYPELANVAVAFVNLGEAKGSYNRYSNSIKLNKNLLVLKNDLKRTLLHEIQHAIQNIEDFSGGTSPDRMAQNLLDNARKNMWQTKDELLSEHPEIKTAIYEYDNEIDHYLFKGNVSDAELKKAYNNVSNKLTGKKGLLKKYAESVENYYGVRNNIDITSYMAYENSAGEIEARDVSERRNLTTIERKNTRPDIDRTDVYFTDNELSYSTKDTFEKQVEDALNGKINKRNALYVSDTSNILLRVGMKQLPILFTQNHLNKAIKPKSSIDSHNHGLTVEQIKYMPEIIAHPAIIMDSMSTNEDIVLISDRLDNDKLPIILVVHPNGQGVYELVTQPTNFIKSYYGKENFKNYVYKAMLNGNLLFIDKRKSQSLYQQMGLQLPHGFYKLGFDKIIHRSNNIVNEKFSLDEDTDEKAGAIHDTLNFSIDDEYGDWLVNDDGKSVFDAVKDEKNPDRRISILYHYAGKTAEHGMSVGKDIRIGQSGMHRLVCNVLQEYGVNLNGKNKSRIESFKSVVNDFENSVKNDTQSFNDAIESLAEECKEYLKKSSLIDKKHSEWAKDLSDSLKEVTLVIPKGDIDFIKSAYGSITNFRKALMGKINIRSTKGYALIESVNEGSIEDVGNSISEIIGDIAGIDETFNWKSEEGYKTLERFINYDLAEHFVSIDGKSVQSIDETAIEMAFDVATEYLKQQAKEVVTDNNANKELLHSITEIYNQANEEHELLLKEKNARYAEQISEQKKNAEKQIKSLVRKNNKRTEQYIKNDIKLRNKIKSNAKEYRIILRATKKTVAEEYRAEQDKTKYRQKINTTLERLINRHLKPKPSNNVPISVVKPLYRLLSELTGNYSGFSKGVNDITEKTGYNKTDNQEGERVNKVTLSVETEKLISALNSEIANTDGKITLPPAMRNALLGYNVFDNNGNIKQHFTGLLEDVRNIFEKAEKNGKTSLKDFSLSELKRISTAFSEVKKLLDTANKIVINGKEYDAYLVSRKGAEELKKVTGTHKKGSNTQASTAKRTLLAYRKYMSDPIRFARMISGYHNDSVIVQMMEMLNQGQSDAEQLSIDWTNKYEEQMSRFSYKAKKDYVREQAMEFDGIDPNTKKALIDKKTGEQVKVGLTADMLVEMLLEYEDEYGRAHMMYSGYQVPNIKYIKRKNQQLMYSKDSGCYILPTESKISRIRDYVMNNEIAKTVYEICREMYNEDMQNAVNKVSNEKYGYEIAKVKNYCPITIDEDTVYGTFADVLINRSINSRAFLHERENFKYNRLKLKGATAKLTSQIKSVSSWCGLTMPIETFNRVFNMPRYDHANDHLVKAVQEENLNSAENIRQKNNTHAGEEEKSKLSIDEVLDFIEREEKKKKKKESTSTTEYFSSMKEIMKQQWGNESEEYISKLMGDLQGSTKQADPGRIDMLTGKYIRAVLTANISSAIKQLSSYPLAAARVGWKATLAGLKHIRPGKHTPFLNRALPDSYKQSIPYDEIAKYTPILEYRKQGNNSREMAEISRYKGLIDSSGWVGHTLDRLNWIEKLDVRMVEMNYWIAYEHVKGNMGISPDSKEFMPNVAKTLEDIINNMMPNSSVMQQGQILRSKNPVNRIFTICKSQVFCMVNAAMDASGEYNARVKDYKQAVSEFEKEQARTEVKIAKKQLARTYSSIIVSTAMTCGILMPLIAALFGKWDRYRDEDGNITPWSVGSRLLKDFGSELTGMFLFGDTVYNTVLALIDKNEEFYGLSLPGVDTINDFITGIINIARSDTPEKLRKNISSLVGTLGMLTGLPTKNLMNLFQGACNHIENFTKYGGTPTVNDYGEVSMQMYANYCYEALIDGDKKKFAKLYSEWLKEKTSTGKQVDKSYINSKLKTELEDDTEIIAAGNAFFNGDLTAYENTVEKYADLGFDKTTVVKAINSIVSDLEDEQKNAEGLDKYDNEEESDSEPELYKYSDAFDFLKNGDTESYEKVEKYLMEHKGKTKTQMKKLMQSASRTDPMFEKYISASKNNDADTTHTLYRQLLNIYGSESSFKSALRKYQDKVKKRQSK